MSIRSAAVLGLLLIARGTTELDFVVEKIDDEKLKTLRDKVSKVPIDAYDCGCDKNPLESWNLGKCAYCGNEVKCTRDPQGEHPISASNEDGVLRLHFQFGGKGLLVVRLSSLESIFKEAGFALKTDVMLIGQFHVHAEKNEKVLAGLKELIDVEYEGVAYHVTAGKKGIVREALEKVFADEKVKIDDYSWTVSRCLSGFGMKPMRK